MSKRVARNSTSASASNPLNRLALAQEFAKRFTLLGVLDSHTLGRKGNPEVGCRVGKAGFGQQVKAEVEALAFFTNHIFGRHTAVFK